ncbi:MAG: hypothetical protein KGJ51_07355 [Acidobacteriota bacterium]|nr:hypothetical protein [Acidobacteriota bacterium]MDE3163412.1 hypothetical protein [Acidobacteriota bacterium]
MSDRLLLLYAIARGNEFGFVDGPFKLMKIPFMAELASTSKQINTFNYSFFRWTFGPLTTDIYEDADWLASVGLSSGKAKPRLTDKGTSLLRAASDLFQENQEAIRFVDDAAKKCAPLTFGPLRTLVYKQVVNVPGKGKLTIADVPTGYNVLSRISTPKSCFSLSDDWIDSLWRHLNYTDDECVSLRIEKPLDMRELVIQ